MHQCVRRIECGRLRAAAPLRAVAEHDGNRALQRINRVQLDAVNERRFIGIALRHDQFAEAGTACTKDHRQNATHRAHRTVECELAKRDKPLQSEPVDLLVDSQQRERDSEVEGRPLFAHVGGGEIDEQPSRRVREARIEDRGPHALTSLGERAIGESDDRQRRGTGGTIGLNPNDIAFDTEHPGAE